MSSSDNLPHLDYCFYGCGGFNSVHELMRAIILRTIDDFNSEGDLHEEAIAYLEDPEEEYIFSFRFICKQLGFDPEKTKEMITNATHRISTRRRAA